MITLLARKGLRSSLGHDRASIVPVILAAMDEATMLCMNVLHFPSNIRLNLSFSSRNLSQISKDVNRLFENLDARRIKHNNLVTITNALDSSVSGRHEAARCNSLSQSSPHGFPESRAVVFVPALPV